MSYTTNTTKINIELLKARKLPFFIVLFCVAFVTYGFLYAIDFIPEDPAVVVEDTNEITGSDSGPNSDGVLGTDELSVQATSDSAVRSSTPHKADGSKTLPVRMVIDSLGKVIPVLNPNSNKIADLDEALLKGAVRHPDSALIGEEGNIFILGHSSYLPQVRNKNFQAFNGIQELKWGDTIKLQSESKEYIYRVDRIYEAKASVVQVPISTGIPKLTLATCNSFGSKDDRFIVEASLVDSYSL